MLFNDEHPEKAQSPIDVTEDGISILSNDEQSEKAYSPIDVTDDGIVIYLILGNCFLI